jgi:hypothetical protein
VSIFAGYMLYQVLALAAVWVDQLPTGREEAEMADNEEVVEPLHLELEDREVYLAKIPVRSIRCELLRVM